MLTDSNIIHRHNGYEVLSDTQAVTWPDGTQATLHTVCFHGHHDMFLRAVMQDDCHLVIFDLRDVTPRSLEGEIKALPARDTEGMVLYTLRQAHTNAGAFGASVLRHHKAAWFVNDKVAA